MRTPPAPRSLRVANRGVAVYDENGIPLRHASRITGDKVRMAVHAEAGQSLTVAVTYDATRLICTPVGKNPPTVSYRFTSSVKGGQPVTTILSS